MPLLSHSMPLVVGNLFFGLRTQIQRDITGCEPPRFLSRELPRNRVRPQQRLIVPLTGFSML